MLTKCLNSRAAYHLLGLGNQINSAQDTAAPPRKGGKALPLWSQ